MALDQAEEKDRSFTIEYLGSTYTGSFLAMDMLREQETTELVTIDSSFVEMVGTGKGVEIRLLGCRDMAVEVRGDSKITIAPPGAISLPPLAEEAEEAEIEVIFSMEKKKEKEPQGNSGVEELPWMKRLQARADKAQEAYKEEGG